MFAATALAIGLHVQSMHMPSKPEHNDRNVGVYLKGESWQVGAYRNTLRRNTLYASYVHHAYGLDWHVGLASGYQKKCQEDRALRTQRVVIDGQEYVAQWTEYWQTCHGWSRGAVAPVGGVSYLFPEVLGAKPRLFFAPGLKGSSSVLHLSIERAF